MDAFPRGEVGWRDILPGLDGEMGDVKLEKGWPPGNTGNEAPRGG